MIEVSLYLLYTFCIILLIYKSGFFRLEGIPRTWIIAAFLVKILASFTLYYIYTYHYTDRSSADIFKYFDDSKVIFDSLLRKPLDFISIVTGIGNDQPYFDQYYQKMNNWYGIYPSNIYGDGHLLIRFNALIRIISLGNYHIHALVMCLLSFIGITGIYKFASTKLPRKNKILFILLFFFPSVVFWSSGILKEGLIFFSLGLILYLIDLMINTRAGILKCLLLIFSFLILRYTKFYIFLIFIPLCLAYLWSLKASILKSGLKYVLILSVTVLLGLFIGFLFPQYDIIHILVRKQNDFLLLAQNTNAGSIINVDPLQDSISSVVTAILPGFIRVLTLPYPWDLRNIFSIIPAAENIFSLLMLLTVLVWHKKNEDDSFFWLCLFFFCFVYSVIGLMTPVIGAIVRYKVIAIPFYFSGLLFLWDKENTIKFLFKQ